MQALSFAKRLFAPAVLAAAVLAVASTGYAEDAPKAASGTATISGKVTGVDGAAAAGVDVRLMAAGGGKKNATEDPVGGEKKKMGAVATTKTDDTGAFKFENVAAGTYQVVAADKKAGAMGRQKITVSDGGSETVEIKLEVKAPKADGAEKKKKD